MNRTVLFLDDDPNRCRAFRSECPFATIVNTAQECIDRLRVDNYDIVFLDHDLGEQQYQDSREKNSGSEVVRWIRENKPKVNDFVVHSLNPCERKNMVFDLRRMEYSAVEIPFTFLLQGETIRVSTEYNGQNDSHGTEEDDSN